RRSARSPSARPDDTDRSAAPAWPRPALRQNRSHSCSGAVRQWARQKPIPPPPARSRGSPQLWPSLSFGGIVQESEPRKEMTLPRGSSREKRKSKATPAFEKPLDTASLPEQFRGLETLARTVRSVLR